MEKKWVRFREEYEVSSTGDVKSLARTLKNGKHHKEMILKPQFVGEYLGVYLPDQETGKQKWEYIHKLVAQAFIPNPENLPQVNHINEDKTDNRVENLEWCTKKYNNNYGTARKRAREKNIKTGRWKNYDGWTEEDIKKDKKLRYQGQPKMEHTVYVYERVVSYRLVDTFKNAAKAAQSLNVSDSSVYHRLQDSSMSPIKKKYVVTKEKL